MKKLLLCLFTLSFCFTAAFAQKEIQKEYPQGFAITLQQDPAFGFYPGAFGSIGLSDNLSFTFYGIFFTQEALGIGFGGQPAAGGKLFTEFGVGLNYSMLDGCLNINPSIGIDGGNYASGGGRVVIGDCIVPEITFSYAKNDFKCSATLICWKGFRKEGNVTPYLDLLEYVIIPTYNVSNHFAVGLYYDHFFTRFDNSNNPTSYSLKGTYSTYHWLGPLVKITLKSGTSLAFTAGVDFVEKDHNALEFFGEKSNNNFRDYYKLSLLFPM